MTKYPSGYKKYWAVYLPSIQDMFLTDLKKSFGDIRDGDVPRHIPEMSSLNFWSGDGLFYWPNLLYSPGAKKFKKDWESQIEKHKSDVPDMANRDRSTSFCMVDSGGFQIVTDNKFTFLTYNDIDQLNIHRLGLLRWQEEFGDMAITFEAPSLTAKIYGETHPRLKTDDACLEFTLESMEFAQKHQEQDVKWIAPIQGATFEKQKEWYNAIKSYKPYGYAFPCSKSDGQSAPFRNAFALIQMLQYMKDDGAFKYCRHIHLLGIVGPMPAVFATAIKGCFNNYLEPVIGSKLTAKEIEDGRVEVTFDAASYSVAMSTGTMYVDSMPDALAVARRQTIHIPMDEVDKKTGQLIRNVSDEWAINHDQIPGDMRSPILDGLRFSDFVGWTETPYKKTGLNNRIWDAVARAIMVAQNVWQETQQINDSLTWTSNASMYASGKNSVYLCEWSEIEEIGNIAKQTSDIEALSSLLIHMGEELLEFGELDEDSAESVIIQFIENHNIVPDGLIIPGAEVKLEKALRVESLVRAGIKDIAAISDDDKKFLESLF